MQEKYTHILLLLPFIKKRFSMNYMANLLLSLILLIFVPSVNAQELSTGVAVPIRVNTDQEILDGSIVCPAESGFVLCEGEYNTEMYGVVTDNPSTSFDSPDIGERRFVLSSGIVTVRVSTQNGNISEGDLLTTSDTPGVAVLAENNGYVLGTALDSFESEDAENIGRIPVSLSIHFNAGTSSSRSNLVQVLRQGLEAPLLEPLAAFRYFLAALMVLLAFVFGFIYFGRASRAGIEAVGRNPLAAKMIRLSVLLHIAITIVIIGAGLFLAYLILIL